jgi:hypothetical protein
MKAREDWTKEVLFFSMEQKTTRLLPPAIFFLIISYLLIFTGHPVLSMWAGGFSALLGLGGLIRSASPRIGGGVLSALAAVLGLLASFIAGLEDIGVIHF